MSLDFNPDVNRHDDKVTKDQEYTPFTRQVKAVPRYEYECRPQEREESDRAHHERRGKV